MALEVGSGCVRCRDKSAGNAEFVAAETRNDEGAKSIKCSFEESEGDQCQRQKVKHNYLCALLLVRCKLQDILLEPVAFH
ncbi:hypothetical protein AB4Z51_43695 [Bradyrhizobium sp. 2TAF36]|uniref:hypothetical protein n=1 Tax=Bradyrhizobium sp. 2TAF36 TaxID=3233016 RepID=UPI003F92786B